jgi:dTDP-4-amino-4,6-dideoxygalactose transaminase
VRPIPFNRPLVLDTSYVYLREAAASGHLSGDGPFTRKCHALLEQILKAPQVLLTPSCTHALEMTALLLDIQRGDEIIIPSFTFASTVNAFVLRGARPRFVDIRPDTLNMDEKQLGRLITARTRALVPVHYAGVGCEMDSICSLAERRELAVVEDNAHGLLGKYRGRYLGTFGSLAALSFHASKNFTCGEGGALLLNEPRFTERAEILREKGTNRTRLFRGQVDKYSWVDLGSSYLLSDASAALLYSQLEAREHIQARRRQIWHRYTEQLQGWAEEQGILLPFVPPHCEQPYHMFYMLLPSLEDRQALIAHLRAQGIESVFHYLPLHLSEMGRRFGGREGDCPVTEAVSDRLVRLPFYYELTEADQGRVIKAIHRFHVEPRLGLIQEILDHTARRQRAA